MNRVQLAAAGLFAAWMMHDLEELATMSGTSRNLVTRLPSWVPAPAPLRDQGLTNRHIAASIATVGTVVATAAVRGYRTQGRSAFYQNTLLGFGLHGFGHISVSLVTRGYISGVATAPTIVIPYWLWATRTLDRAGVPNQRNAPVAIALTASAIASGHLLAHLITRTFPSGACPAPAVSGAAQHQMRAIRHTRTAAIRATTTRPMNRALGQARARGQCD